MNDIDSLSRQLERLENKLDARLEKIDDRLRGAEKHIWMIIGGVTLLGATFGYMLKALGDMLRQ